MKFVSSSIFNRLKRILLVNNYMPINSDLKKFDYRKSIIKINPFTLIKNTVGVIFQMSNYYGVNFVSYILFSYLSKEKFLMNHSVIKTTT